MMKTLSTNRSHGGTQGVYSHASASTGTEMTFSVFVPDHEAGQTLPVIWYLSGLTCTHANVTEKGEFREICAELGIIFIAPDTFMSMRRKRLLISITTCGAISSANYLLWWNRNFQLI